MAIFYAIHRSPFRGRDFCSLALCRFFVPGPQSLVPDLAIFRYTDRSNVKRFIPSR